MSEAVFYVYVLFRPWDGTPFYVGKGKGNRAYRHVYQARTATSKNKNVKHIFDRAAAERLEVPVVLLNQNLREADAFELECIAISIIGRKAHGGPLVNLTDGGEGPTGYKHDPDLVERLAAAKRGKKYPPEVRRAISAAKLGKPRLDLRGVPHTAEHNAKISAANKGKNLGKKASNETRAKMSAIRAGRKRGPQSPERRQKTVEAWARWRERNGRPPLCL